MSVKRSLTSRRREREIPDYAQMVRRIIRAHGRRCAAADPEDLVGLIELTQSIDEATTEAVYGLRASGFSWAEIARPLGITRQAAQMRYGNPVADHFHQLMLADLAEHRALLAAADGGDLSTPCESDAADAV